MSLFTVDDAHNYALPQHQQATVIETPEPDESAHSLIGRVSDVVADVFPEIKPGHSYHYASAGLWSVHDLLFYLLHQTGPADVWIATWSMTEDSCRMLVQGLEAGLIRSLRLLIDARVIRRNTAAYNFVKNHADQVRITANHAKVTVIENEAWAIAINGSPNYTNNPRIEAGVVTENRLVARAHKSWIEAEMAKAKPFGEHLSGEKKGRPKSGH
jgi:hypothetical protein